MGYQRINPEEAKRELVKAWSPIVLGDIDNYQLKLTKFEGEYAKHRHVYHDELIYVYEGEIDVEFEDSVLNLKAGEGVVIKHNTIHRSKCKSGYALVLLFERKSIQGDLVVVSE